MQEDPCPICEGAGLRVVDRPDGTRVAQPCICRTARRSIRMVERAGIPRRHQHCTLETYRPDYAGKNHSLSAALLMARQFENGYPLMTDGKGLLFTGGFGVGKTHLAVGILKKLIVEKGASGIFCDYRTLLKQIQDSYSRSDVSERQVLAPIFEADVLVIDELGAAKPTDWVWDMVQHILNTRYNDRRTTIITTNYRNERELPMGHWDELPRDKRDSVKAMYRDNLGDRITERMRSRLLEMCVVIEMEGADYRESSGRADFGNSTPLTRGGSRDEAQGNQHTSPPDERAQVVSKLRIPQQKRGIGARSPVGQVKPAEPVEGQSSLLQPDRIWTQDDLDREVALKTASQLERRRYKETPL